MDDPKLNDNQFDTSMYVTNTDIEREYIVGIDNGTTTNVICYKDVLNESLTTRPTILTDMQDSVCIPSWITYHEQHKAEIGKQAQEYANQTNYEKCTIYNNKRFIAKRYGEIIDKIDKYPYKIKPASTTGNTELKFIRYELTNNDGNTFYVTPFDVAVFTFKQWKHELSMKINFNQIIRVVLSVPAYHECNQRQMLFDAGM